MTYGEHGRLWDQGLLAWGLEPSDRTLLGQLESWADLEASHWPSTHTQVVFLLTDFKATGGRD